MEEQQLFITAMCQRWAVIERQTLDCFGDEAALFINVANDWSDILGAILDSYPEERDRDNLILCSLSGLLKEITWLNFVFLAGNYPLLSARLRFIWELIYRAYYAEGKTSGLLDEKMKWLQDRESNLNWPNCIEPSLKELFEKARRKFTEADQRQYRALWKKLHVYVHPSAYLADRITGSSALLTGDKFDLAWARDSLIIGKDIFDLVFFAVLMFHAKAIAQVRERGLIVRYRLVGDFLRGKGPSH
jgi:hypothetical protein